MNSNGSTARELRELREQEVAADLAHQIEQYSNRSYFGDNLGLTYDTTGPHGDIPAFTVFAVADDESQRQFRVTVAAQS